VIGYKWFMREDFRVVANISKSKGSPTHIRLHNLIMDFNPSKEAEVDHEDLNPLNNRKRNLRVVSKSKNLMNRALQSNNNTGVCGVVSRDSNNTPPWVPQIKKGGKMKRLGTKYTFDEAVISRVIAESSEFGSNSNNYNKHTKTLQLRYVSHDDDKTTFIECDLDGNLVRFEKESK